MSRINVIKITAVLYIAYDPDVRGDTGRAEAVAADLEKSISANAGVAVEEWTERKARVTVPE